MWSLMAAPLFFAGDMNQLDEFTLNVLCNAEVIGVDQDPLGWQARVIRHNDSEFVLAKPLEDGSVAVGLFNLGERRRSSPSPGPNSVSRARGAFAICGARRTPGLPEGSIQPP